MSAWLATPFGIVCFAVLAIAAGRYPQLSGWWYPLTLGYAVLIRVDKVIARGQVIMARDEAAATTTTPG